MLYGLSTILLRVNWVFLHCAFIGHGDNSYTIYETYVDFGPWWRMYYLVSGITGGISTFLVNITIVCYFIYSVQWERSWHDVVMALLGPLGFSMASNCCTNCLRCWRYRWAFVLCLWIYRSTSTSAMKGMQMFSDLCNLTDNTRLFTAEVDWSLIYIILVLATTLLCTFLIAYRIICYTPEISASRKIMEIFIESSAIICFPW